MLIQNEVPIVLKAADFYQELYLKIEKMPKKDKYILGEKLSLTTLDLMELLLMAGNSNNQKEKKSLLLKASIKLDLLKILIRLAEEIKAMPTKHYLSLQERLQEIGRMLGGWIKAIKI